MEEKDLSNLYLKFLLDFISTIRKASFYPAKHPAVAEAIENLHALLSQILSMQNTLTLDITQDDKVLMDGKALEEKGISFRRGLSYFRKAYIENLTFALGVSEQELTGLIALLLADSSEIRQEDDIKKILLDRNIQHIHISRFSYVKIKKDEEALAEKIKITQLQALKARIKSLSSGEGADSRELESIETDIFRVIVQELKEKKRLASPLKSVLRRFISYCADREAVLNRLRSYMLEDGFSQQEATDFMDRIRRDVSMKAAGLKKTDTQQYQELIKANEELNERLVHIQEELSQKSALLEMLQEQSKNISEEKERIDNIIHGMTEGMIVVDPQGKILMVNPAAETLLGISKQDVGRQIKDTIKDEHLLSLVKSFPAQEPAVSKDIELFSPNETTLRVLRASSAVVEDHNGNTVGMVAILNDVTRQKQIEKLKSDFVALVSHELRTPLVAVEHSLGLICDGTTGSLSNEQAKFLDMARRNLKRLTLLINDLLDLSRLEAGKVRLVREPCFIEKIVRETLATLKPWADTKSIGLVQNIQEGLPQAEFDSNKIIQVLINLISNAIKFTPGGGTITVEGIGLEDKEIKVTVQDTGIGIPEEELPKVFERFYQVRSSEKSDVKGTGIGLTITKEIVELHGGKIWAESEVEKGTKFFFTLPLKAPHTSKDKLDV
ncbi:MAG: ATP-binding protein [Candidatus Omnitrophota bacterium]